MLDKFKRRRRAKRFIEALEESRPKALKLGELSFKYIQCVYYLMREPIKLEGEDEYVAQALGMHPEYHKLFEGDLQEGENEEFIHQTTDGMSPGLHLGVHSAVFKQLDEKDPPEVFECYEKLRHNGLSRHNILHVLGAAWLGILHDFQEGFAPPQAIERYVERLRGLIDSSPRTFDAAMKVLEGVYE